jgi:hypothetical protein
MNTNPVDRFIYAIEHAALEETECFADDAVLDATVPNWRFAVHGGAGVRQEFARWYGHPGRFEHLQRFPVPDGELVEFTLSWIEDGVPHRCHQAHHLAVADGGIVADTVWCGGRWPAPLLAEMQAAAATA